MTGEDLLQAMLQYERLGYADRGLGYCKSDYAHDLLGYRDARKIVGPVKRLLDAKLIEQDGAGRIRPTERGREVDRILGEITVARGGSFRGRLEAGITHSESYALR